MIKAFTDHAWQTFFGLGFGEQYFILKFGIQNFIDEEVTRQINDARLKELQQFCADIDREHEDMMEREKRLWAIILGHTKE
jgi:hypothetical protein